MTVQIIGGPYADLDATSQRRVLDRCWPANPMVIGGKPHVQSGRLEMTTSHNGTTITNLDDPVLFSEPCEHCHRFDTRPKVAYSLDEAIAFGWLIPVSERAS